MHYIYLQIVELLALANQRHQHHPQCEGRGGDHRPVGECHVHYQCACLQENAVGPLRQRVCECGGVCDSVRGVKTADLALGLTGGTHRLESRCFDCLVHLCNVCWLGWSDCF